MQVGGGSQCDRHYNAEKREEFVVHEPSQKRVPIAEQKRVDDCNGEHQQLTGDDDAPSDRLRHCGFNWPIARAARVMKFSVDGPANSGMVTIRSSASNCSDVRP